MTQEATGEVSHDYADRGVLESLVGNQPADEVVNDCGDGIVATKTLVEGLLFRALGHRLPALRTIDDG